MLTFLLRRSLIALGSVAGASIVLFTVLALAPGDVFAELVSNPGIPADVVANLRAQLGLDQPVYIRYLLWASSMLQGDWGYSFVNRIPVEDLILQRLPATFMVVGSSQILALLIALPVGVYAALRPYSLFDQIASALTFVGFSLPTFFTGLLFILLFSISLGWLPFIYRGNLDVTGWAWVVAQVKQSLMPVVVLAMAQAASWTRYVRSSALEVVQLEYVVTARAKGMPERQVIVKHVLRNALIPVVTMVALELPAVFGGAIVTEQIFRVPGVGSLLISSILANDTPVIMAVTFVVACLVILFNLIADMLYRWLDPRIK